MGNGELLKIFSRAVPEARAFILSALPTARDRRPIPWGGRHRNGLCGRAHFGKPSPVRTGRHPWKGIRRRPVARPRLHVIHLSYRVARRPARNPWNWSLLVPLGVRRPPAAGQALRGHPPEEAHRAYSAGVESVPAMAAGARPPVVRAWGPVAQRAADTGTGAVAVLVVPDILTEFGFHKGGHFPSVSHRIRGAATGG